MTSALLTPLIAHAADFANGARPPANDTFGWLVLFTPLVGAILIGIGYKKFSPKAAGAIGTLAIFMAFAAATAWLWSGMLTVTASILSPILSSISRKSLKLCSVL